MRTGVLNKLTAKAVQSAGDGLHSDGGGLFLRVRGNSKVWLFRFTRDGKKREMGLGAVSLAEARLKAADARAKVSDGIDPIANRTKPERQRITFKGAVDRHLKTNNPTWSNPKHRQQWHNTLHTYAAPLMHMPVDEITTAHVADCLMPIWLEKAETASRVRGRIEKVLSACIARGERLGPNPAALKDNLQHILPKQAVTVKHHAAVPVDEAPAAFAALWGKRRAGQGYAAAVTMILSACRSGEVRHMQWDDIVNTTITLPAERMKMRRNHRIPVNWGLALHLSETPRWAGTKLIHPSRSTNRSISDMTIAQAMRRSGLGDYTPHGWRSTLSVWAKREGFARELAEDQLAHTIGSKVERAYQREDYLEQRRAMMERWSQFLAGGL